MGCYHGDSGVGQAHGPLTGGISGLLPSSQDDRSDDRCEILPHM